MAAAERDSTSMMFLALGVVTALLVLASLWQIFAVAPVEEQMGIVQKIFYFHVPSAYAMYLGFVVCAVASIGYLVSRKDAWDAVAAAGGEVGLLFCTIVLITGPLWGRKAWGVAWVWDPRLTTTLLAGLIFASYVVLRAFGTGEAERRLAAVLAILGLVDLPIIHWSVDRWRGQHPTVITSSGGGLDPDMYPALYVSFAAFTAMAGLLIWGRARAERGRQRLRAVEMDAAERGLLEGT
jgi:heme exporter protein C